MRRWTSFSEDWQEDVGSVAVESADGLLHFDPLDPPERADHTFITVFFHARGARGRVWAPARQVKRLANRGVEVTDPFEPGDELPGGVECFTTAREGEVVYWVPSERALIVGDVLLGAGAKPRKTDDPLRLCPDRWVGGGKDAGRSRGLATAAARTADRAGARLARRARARRRPCPPNRRT